MVGPDCSVGASDLFKAYKVWAEEERLSPRETLSSTLFGSRMSAKFDRRRSKRGNRYVGVGLYTDRGDRDAETSDEGVGLGPLVQGCESDDPENEVFSQRNHLSRENPEKPYTTLHPTPDDDARCVDCGREMSVARTSDRCGYCKAAATR